MLSQQELNNLLIQEHPFAAEAIRDSSLLNIKAANMQFHSQALTQKNQTQFFYNIKKHNQEVSTLDQHIMRQQKLLRNRAKYFDLLAEKAHIRASQLYLNEAVINKEQKQIQQQEFDQYLDNNSRQAIEHIDGLIHILETKLATIPEQCDNEIAELLNEQFKERHSVLTKEFNSVEVHPNIDKKQLIKQTNKEMHSIIKDAMQSYQDNYESMLEQAQQQGNSQQQAHQHTQTKVNTNAQIHAFRALNHSYLTAETGKPYKEPESGVVKTPAIAKIGVKKIAKLLNKLNFAGKIEKIVKFVDHKKAVISDIKSSLKTLAQKRAQIIKQTIKKAANNPQLTAKDNAAHKNHP